MRFGIFRRGTSVTTVKDFFEGVPKELRREVLKKAIRAGGMVIAEEARRRAPMDTGYLREQINVYKRRAKKGSIRYDVDIGDAYYGYFIELGFLKQPVVVMKGGRLISIKAPKEKRTQIAPRPFMRPAFESRAAEARRVITQYVREWVNKLKINRTSEARS